jgi:hypothetical protein
MININNHSNLTVDYLYYFKNYDPNYIFRTRELARQALRDMKLTLKNAKHF